MATRTRQSRTLGTTAEPVHLSSARVSSTYLPLLGVRPVLGRIFDAADGFEELRDRLVAEWKAGESAWTPEARAVFAELELEAGAKRSLLESPTFRALLDRPPLAQAA